MLRALKERYWKHYLGLMLFVAILINLLSVPQTPGAWNWPCWYNSQRQLLLYTLVPTKKPLLWYRRSALPWNATIYQETQGVVSAYIFHRHVWVGVNTHSFGWTQIQARTLNSRLKTWKTGWQLSPCIKYRQEDGEYRPGYDVYIIKQFFSAYMYICGPISPSFCMYRAEIMHVI